MVNPLTLGERLVFIKNSWFPDYHLLLVCCGGWKLTHGRHRLAAITFVLR